MKDLRELFLHIRKDTGMAAFFWPAFQAIAGLLLLFRPATALLLVSRLVGIVLLVCGIRLLYRYFTMRRAEEVMLGFTGFIPGIILTIAGGSITAHPVGLIRMAGGIMALVLLVTGGLLLHRIRRIRQERSFRWWLCAAGAVLEILMGILLLVAPFTGSQLVVRLIGCAFLYTAFSGLLYALRLRSRTQDAERQTDTAAWRRFSDMVGRYTGKDMYGRDIIDGTAEDVTDERDTH